MNERGDGCALRWRIMEVDELPFDRFNPDDEFDRLWANYADCLELADAYESPNPEDSRFINFHRNESMHVVGFDIDVPEMNDLYFTRRSDSPNEH